MLAVVAQDPKAFEGLQAAEFIIRWKDIGTARIDARKLTGRFMSYCRVRQYRVIRISTRILETPVVMYSITR